jgi:hypothetical protein
MLSIVDFIKDNNFVIDNKYFKLFWKIISTENIWIYLSDEIIKNDMGYKKINSFYHDTLRKKYKENIDYKEIDKNDNLVKFYEISNNNHSTLGKKYHTGGKVKKYYVVSRKTLKMLFLQCRTYNGISLCNYFIDLEQIFISYLHYQCKYNNLNIYTEINILCNLKNIDEYSKLIRKQELDQKLKEIYRIGYVYYIQEEQSKNIKIGYSFNLERRLSELQVANSQKLNIIKYEKCIFPHIREQKLHKKYKTFSIRGEWFDSNLLEYI